MRKLLFFISLLLFEGAIAQTTDWERIPGGNQCRGLSIATDAAGNVYTTGYFSGSVNFTGTTGVHLFSAGSNDIFVSKFDDLGNFLWQKRFGGTGDDKGNGIALDNAGNVYVTGSFSNTADFGTGINLTSAGNTDIFICKLNATTGNVLWAKQMGGLSGEEGSSITVNSGGNDIYITGYFGGTADFDPSASVTNLTATASVETFVCKLNATGSLVWAKQTIGQASAGNKGKDIGLDSTGNIYVVGNFTGFINFGSINLVSNGITDMFITKLNPTSGNFVWVKQVGGIGEDYGNGIALDALDNVYITGSFYDTVDFDPSATSEFNLTTSPALGGGLATHSFVNKLDTNGNFVWVKEFVSRPLSTVSSNTYANSIGIDTNNNIYITGAFGGTVDFNPDPIAEHELANYAANNLFICKLNSVGAFVWVRAVAYGLTTVLEGLDVAINNCGGAHVISKKERFGDNEIFIIKLIDENTTPNFTPINSICEGTTPSPLPTTSLNGITGTWSPAFNNMATTTYTFAPDPGQCATARTMTVAVIPSVIQNPMATVTHLGSDCALGQILVGVSPSAVPYGAGYEFSINGTTFQSSPLFTNLSAGVYTVTVRAVGISCTKVILVTVNDNLPNAGVTYWNGSSWSNGIGATKEAVLNADYNTSLPGAGSFECRSLTIPSGRRLTITDFESATVYRDFISSTTDASVVISNNGSLIQLNGSSTGPKITLNKITQLKRNYDYIYWSSPVVENVISAFSPSFDLFYKWRNGFVCSPSNTCAWIATTTTQTAGIGIASRVRSNLLPNNIDRTTIPVTFNGTANSGTIYQPVVSDGTVETWNYSVLGNPYPSGLDAAEFLTRNPNLWGQVAFWTSATISHFGSGTSYNFNDFAYWNLTGGVSSGATALLPNGIITTGQGFSVRAIHTGDVVFDNCMRITQEFGNVLYKSSSVEDRYRINIENTTGAWNQILVGYSGESTIGLDRLYDAYRTVGSGTKLYTKMNTDYFAIQGRGVFETTDVVPLGFYTALTGTQTFSFNLATTEGIFSDTATQPVYIHDLLDDSYHQITPTSSYTFTATIPANGMVDNRFEITYTNATLGMDDSSTNYGLIVRIKDNLLTASCSEDIKSIAVYDVMGRLVKRYDAQNTTDFEAFCSLPKAVYIVKTILTNDMVFSTKILN